MLFSLLTRLLLWLLIAVIAYAILLQWIPKKYYTWLGGILIFTLIILTFFNPSTVVVADIWRLLVFPLTPLGLSIILILSGMLHFKGKEIAKPGKTLLWVGLAILVIFSLPVVADTLAHQAESESVIATKQRYLNCQAACPVPLTEQARLIVLLGQNTTEAVTTEHHRHVQLSDRGNLIFHTLEIFWASVSRNQDPQIIVTGRSRVESFTTTEPPNEAQDIVNVLQRFGIHNSNLQPISQGDNMYRAALQVQKIMEVQGLQKTPIILVTSALQMHRAELTFSQLGMTVIPSPTDFITRQDLSILKKITLEDLIPSSQALTLSTQVTNEYLATIYYFLRGWLSPFK
ncbi:YdcF family protein [Roseofilum capinflatum]|uniref:ElyC/SanA/YdcF family protein n=1 Tax=Roseofilum capinflatum BLCC-M114 TaxID=3022440 RepID=A0ABT7BCC7_9CYAN|nr:YdcF family protein [Roseofilum capinflatum]MDJ1176848.1 ElyC/SanA/YdcF family protein [Roseofilum capinflatum BLCC-M114]